MSNNHKCRVLLKGETTPRDMEVITLNQSEGHVIVHDRPSKRMFDKWATVYSGFGGWYEVGMQILDAEAGLTRGH